MSSRSFGIALVYTAATMCSQVHSGSRGLLGRAEVSSHSFDLCAQKCRLFHSGSRGITRERLRVVGFIQVRVGSVVVSKRSQG